METIAVLLVLGGIVGGVYAIWRLVRRQRAQDPDGHPRVRVAAIASLVALGVGSAIMPAEDQSEPDAQRASKEPEAQRAAGERGEGADDQAARERKVAQREAEAQRDETAQRERQAAERRRRAGDKTGRVSRVIDGDTVELEGVGRVRLTGVDTPERGEECFDEATDYLRQRVGGKTVRYRYQRERKDRYDRALLDLFRGGELINLDIAQAGWGEELTIAPNDRYSSRIRKAEQEALSARRGRWGGCADAPASPPKPERSRTPPAPSDDGGGGVGSAPPYPPDVDCSDLSGPVAVGPGDPHKLDRDGDGVGCE